MSPLQAPPDPFTQLMYKLYYGIKGLWYALFGPKKN
jgi:hypothetical protein